MDDLLILCPELTVQIKNIEICVQYMSDIKTVIDSLIGDAEKGAPYCGTNHHGTKPALHLDIL